MLKKVTISVISLLIFIPLFMWTPLAEPKNVYNTPYGTYTTDYTLINDNQYGEINIGPFVIYAVDKNVSTFKYQFNNYYTGTVTINTFTNINPTDSLASYKPEMFTDNCTILSYTNTSVTFYIKNVKEFSATLVYPTGNSQFNIQAWANPGTTNITVQTDTQTAVNQILSYVQFINEDSFSIAADITTIKNKLFDSLGYGNSDDTIESDFNNIQISLDQLKETIQNINTYGDIPYYSYGAYGNLLHIGELADFDSNGFTFSEFKKAIQINKQYSYDVYYEINIQPEKTFHLLAYINKWDASWFKLSSQYTDYELNRTVLENTNNFVLVDYYYKNETGSTIYVNIAPDQTNNYLKVIPIYMGTNIPISLAHDYGIEYYDEYLAALDRINNSISNINVDVSLENVPGYSYQAYANLMHIGTIVPFVSNNYTFDEYMSAVQINKTFSYDTNYEFNVPAGKEFHFLVYQNKWNASWFKLVNSSGTNYSLTRNLLSYVNNMVLVDYYYNNTSNSTLWVNLAPDQINNYLQVIPIYLGVNLPSSVALEYNIEFTNSYIRAINDVKDAINNMSINVNNLTVNATGITYNTNQTQVTNSVTNYNTNINQVYNVENNISVDFDNYNQQFTPDFTNPLAELQDTKTLMNGIINQINGIQLFTTPILLTLVGIVLLAILG